MNQEEETQHQDNQKEEGSESDRQLLKQTKNSIYESDEEDIEM
jgi:hypothetical protein